MIKIKKDYYSYTKDGPYDSISTIRTARSTVTIHTLIKVFDDDEYLHKAKEWVNKTFAEDKYNTIKAAISEHKLEIERIKANIKENERKLSEFLVDVVVIE